MSAAWDNETMSGGVNNKLVFTKQRPRFLQNVPRRGDGDADGPNKKRMKETEVGDPEEEFLRNAPVVEATQGKKTSAEGTGASSTVKHGKQNEGEGVSSTIDGGSDAKAKTETPVASATVAAPPKAEALMHNHRANMLSFSGDDDDD